MTAAKDHIFTRVEQLLGEDGFCRLQQKRVIVFGVGGVGGWCAEALVRSGIRCLTIVDFDVVDITNVNRQVVATSLNVGQSKVEQMRQRLLQINPVAQIEAVNERFCSGTSSEFCLSDYDYVIDAIDSLRDKAELILAATAAETVLFSSMGAARKNDPTQIRTAEFWKVEGCPLARSLRKFFKANGRFPAKKFKCVYSPEQSAKSGTLATVVGSFGFLLASMLIDDAIKERNK